MPKNQTKKFYDELSYDYHLIFDNWDNAIKRHAKNLNTIIKEYSKKAGFHKIKWLMPKKTEFYQPIIIAFKK